MTTLHFYADSPTPDRWFGPHDTLEQAIEAGRAFHRGEPFHVNTGHLPTIADFMNADAVIDQLAATAYDAAGEAVGDWPDVTDDGRAALEALLSAWGEKYAPIGFYVVDGTSERIDP